jgi:DMSO/TMAO reductase YedYZ molybdopterin-dependent catalytic subunit
VISREELQLATRNHGMPLEALRHPITPIGLHYLLIHYDIPFVDASTWALEVDGAVDRPARLSLDDLRALPSVEVDVTMECAGNGRALLEPHVVSQPWLRDAVGTARWRGAPLAALLDRSGVRDAAVEVLFTALDRGVEGDVTQEYQRSLPLAEARRDEVLLAYEMNGAPLLPQHGFPLRLVVPGWYGMTNVKWLARVTVLTAPFEGYQQASAYRLRASDDDLGTPVERMLPRSLLVPPGIPEFLTRTRTLDPGRCLLEGRAWCGRGEVERVEVTLDGGASWARAELRDDEQLGPWAWRRWTFTWDARPGTYRIGSRAADDRGDEQPLEPVWNVGGYANNAVQWVDVTVPNAVKPHL